MILNISFTIKLIPLLATTFLLICSCEKPRGTKPLHSDIERALKKEGLQSIDSDLFKTELLAGNALATRLRKAGLLKDPDQVSIVQCKLLTNDKSIALIVYGLKDDNPELLKAEVLKVMDEFRLNSIEVVREYIVDTPNWSFLRHDSAKYSKENKDVSLVHLKEIDCGLRTELTIELSP